MNTDSTGRGLFIVDNSVTGWTGLRYLEEWAEIAKAFDIATGFFEIGALPRSGWEMAAPREDSRAYGVGNRPPYPAKCF